MQSPWESRRPQESRSIAQLRFSSFLHLLPCSTALLRYFWLLQAAKNRGDSRSFEPFVHDYVATFLRPGPEVQTATRVLKLAVCPNLGRMSSARARLNRYRTDGASPDDRSNPVACRNTDGA